MYQHAAFVAKKTILLEKMYRQADKHEANHLSIKLIRCVLGDDGLTHWGRDKMVAIF